MAKVPFTKLGLKKKEEALQVVTFNENDIQVKQYLPIAEKADLIARVINIAADGKNYVNPIQVDLFSTLEIIYAYTNLSFTDKQKSEPTKLYDLLTESGLVEAIFDVIPEDELEMICTNIWDTIEAVFTYQNSIMGILESVSQNYDALQFDTTKLQQAIKDPENLSLLKDVLTKLG